MMKMLLLLLLLLLLLALSSSSLRADVTLSSVDDFTGFVNSVNSGSNYSGTTVYLGSDLPLSGETLDPIGNDTYYFLGTFDGQGHTISDLQMNSSSRYTGLFGHSEGLTIKNVVLDSSCSITSSFINSGLSEVRIGGIIGDSSAGSGYCNIENSVNMADVAFNGNTSSNLFIGGIAGGLHSYSSDRYYIYVKNCVNYGSVMHSGTVNGGRYAELGGIAGTSDGSSPSYHYIQNCLNYGTITYNGTSSRLIIGGIVGFGQNAYIKNCVSAGKIAMQTTATGDNYVGSIVGSVRSNVNINYCCYTSDVNASSIYGYASYALGTTGTINSTTDVDSDLVSKLNSKATNCNWDKWLLNANNATVTFKMGDDKELSFSSQVILTPYPVKEGYTLFWCKDAECTEEFDSDSVSGNIDLYARWTPNNYTVTFDFNYDGSILVAFRIVTFDEEYGGLPGLNRAGYMLIGWFTDAINGTEVTIETIVTTPYNHTLYAHWEEVTNQVEIVFNTKDLTQEDVEKLIGQYTKADFTIEKFENESDEIRAIVKFTDREDAEEFIRKIKESNRTTNLIKRIGFDKGDYDSSSTMIYPLSFLSTLFL